MQNTRKISGGLIALCILTIIGSLWIIVKSSIELFLFDVENVDAQITLNIYFSVKIISSLGTIAAAIFMLNRRYFGYKLYVSSLLLYYIVVVFSLIFMLIGPFIVIGFFQIISMIPPIIFLALYSAKRDELDL